ncbi:CAP domain-containing protein [Trichothermofontia sichuanensis B231]|uniref:CAP domain-containing protein n=1 Tax=Trichothermofontia sichuanensis TaxID=3045816 RepID=UPI0022460D17|nr:CAP domain-containing protein [Trichothermofontia sichuanensis]UZQ55057.1 CAP domain-containing protein [Trichothermofontia sichuanensis B231]
MNPFQPSCIFQSSCIFQLTRSGNQPRQPTPEQPTINPSGSNSTIAQEMLAAHNQWRSRVGVPPLRWSPQLTSYAQEWANYLASTGQFNHRPQQQYGENLFWGSGRRWSPTEVVNDWGSEVRDYDYASNRCRSVCGHYTQVVWSRTTEVGCAVGRSGNQEVWVGNYHPPGNFIGQRPY